ncbi:MAG: Lrp/AsnC family transcriptional regulator [Crenarchaeota archaeon]|nr:Lrp/AsnC family transcriptional regulator [Thermoproteota archaeon]
MSFELDEVDIAIISLLQRNGIMSTREIGRFVGLSHTAIGKRLRRLPIKVTAVFSKDIVRGMILVIGKVRTSSAIEEMINVFKDCPRMLMFASGGSNRYMALMFAEDPTVIDCISLDCEIRAYHEVEESRTYILDRVHIPDYIYIKIPTERRDVAPCGRNCSTCRRFKEGLCPGCPATRYYRGPLIARRRRSSSP